MRYRQLGKTGMRLSIISLGGSGYGNVYGDHNDAVAKKSLEYVNDMSSLSLLFPLHSLSLFFWFFFKIEKEGERERERERETGVIFFFTSSFVPCCVVILYRYKFCEVKTLCFCKTSYL